MNPVLTILSISFPSGSILFLSVSSVLMGQIGSNRDQNGDKGSNYSILGSALCTYTCANPQSTFVENDEKKVKKWPKMTKIHLHKKWPKIKFEKK